MKQYDNANHNHLYDGANNRIYNDLSKFTSSWWVLIKGSSQRFFLTWCWIAPILNNNSNKSILMTLSLSNVQYCTEPLIDIKYCTLKSWFLCRFRFFPEPRPALLGNKQLELHFFPNIQYCAHDEPLMLGLSWHLHVYHNSNGLCTHSHVHTPKQTPKIQPRMFLHGEPSHILQCSLSCCDP